MNFRPNHTCNTASLWIHRAFVLLGWRPSIGSILRSTILSDLSAVSQSDPLDPASSLGSKKTLMHRATELSRLHISPCYITLCDGQDAIVIEKDLYEGTLRCSSDFIIQTNYDFNSSTTCTQIQASVQNILVQQPGLGAEAWLEESAHRLDFMAKKWARHARRSRQSAITSLGEDSLRLWMVEEPIMNECTHFATIMDAKTGQLRWCQRGWIEMQDDLTDKD